MYQALYRKWRPVTFDDVCGQDHITDILKFETEQNRISHAYLFCGPRGTGKTSCAKILAKAINCFSPINGNPCGECEACKSIDNESTTDVLEMDAASNNGVDAVRAIRDEVVYTPSGMKYRVYIVDEVHMLSISAFNALLKTLEEPPAHVVFVLATTELQKLPATIISRCQRFDFRRISTSDISSRLRHIATVEGIDIDDDAIRIIAKHANGGMRDAISLLDLCSSSGGKLNGSRVEDILGISNTECIRNIAKAVLKNDYGYIFSTVHSISTSSVDISVFWQDLLSFYRDMLVVKTTADSHRFLDSTTEEIEIIKAISTDYPFERLLYHIKLLDEALGQMQRSGSTKRIIAELTFIKMCDATLSEDFSAILSRIAALEDKVNLLALGAPIPVNHAPAEQSDVSDNTNSDAATVASAEDSAATFQTRKNITYWLEIVESLSKEHRSAMGLRNGSRAYKTDDKIVIKVSNSFTIKMVSEDSIKSALASMISSKEGRVYSPENIIFELTSASDSADDDLFDTLI